MKNTGNALVILKYIKALMQGMISYLKKRNIAEDFNQSAEMKAESQL